MTLGSIRQPVILFKTLSENRAEIGLRIPEELAYFEGHFSGLPIVPGVVQLHWAVEFAKDVFKISGFVAEGRQIKFSNLMRPLDEPCLTLEHFSEKALIVYDYKAGEKTYASGRLMYSTSCDEERVTNGL
jgi:3-hydroxymyristoyl/3-hydroxydecanoyl-(acyl carrier protein) dehydratase